MTTVASASVASAEEISAKQAESISEIPHPSLPAGSTIYGSTKIFSDYQAEKGESYLTLVHGIAHESSVSFVAILQATRALRKGHSSPEASPPPNLTSAEPGGTEEPRNRDRPGFSGEPRRA